MNARQDGCTRRESRTGEQGDLMRLVAFGLSGCLLLVGMLPGQGADDLAAAAGSWRSIGPAVMSGRIVDLAVDPGDKNVVYVASASGGVWKTVNRGTTWEPIFDEQPCMTIGDIALAPSNPKVLYVGTGEANNQRSSYWGNGVWRSDDSGKSFRHLGLPESHHIGRIVVHPTDPDTVYVAALGHLYSANPDRGLYRSKDGGTTWSLVLKVNEDVGVVDVAMDPSDPQRLYAATYERRRRAWHFDEGGRGSRAWRSTDGGSTWDEMKEGLPNGELGRIGIGVSLSNPETVYLTVENLNEAPETKEDPTDQQESEWNLDLGEHRLGTPEEEAPGAAAPRQVGGEIYRSDDRGDTWMRVNEKPIGGTPMYYYGQIRVDPQNVEKLWLLGVPLSYSEDGGVTWKRDGARSVHVDHHALWIDPEDSHHLLLGNDGGLARSYDGAKTWDTYKNLPLSQFYAIGVSSGLHYRVYGGLQDNGTWGVPIVGDARSGVTNRHAMRVNGGDGFYSEVCKEDEAIVFCESQFGGLARVNTLTGARRGIKPRSRRGEPRLRFNWNTPIHQSPHGNRVLYVGSQYLHRSMDRGDSWEIISPDLTTSDKLKLQGNVPHCTITSISESPHRKGVIWVGTDDGRVHVTQDGGDHWRDVTDHFPDQVQGLWVSRVAASHHDHGRAFVAFTGYREDRFAPYIFETDDYGGTWRSLSVGLPEFPVNDILEDPEHKDLLFVGTENGVFFSVNHGATWSPLRKGLPHAAVHDLCFQADAQHLLAGTHGRGIYVLDILALRSLVNVLGKNEPHLCKALALPSAPGGFDRGWTGARVYRAQNAPSGARLVFYLPRDPEEGEVSLVVKDLLGTVVATPRMSPKKGLNTVRWNLRRSSARGGQRGGQGRRGGGRVPAGSYTVVLGIGDQELKQHLAVLDQPDIDIGPPHEEAVPWTPDY